MKTVKITIGKVGVDMINKFVEESYASSLDYYKTRGQENADKIKQDIYNGRLAELAVYKHYHGLEGCQIGMPDFNVYDGSNKSYEADLFFTFNEKKYNLHVKSQHIDQANRFGSSWSFQKNDSLTTRPVKEDMVCLCKVINKTTVEIMKPIKATKLIGVYGEPKLERLKHSKAVLYWKDLIENKIIQ